MRQRSTAIRRYALARPGAGQASVEERVQRLRLVRMEEIAELDRAPSPPRRLKKA